MAMRRVRAIRRSPFEDLPSEGPFKHLHLSVVCFVIIPEQMQESVDQENARLAGGRDTPPSSLTSGGWRRNDDVTEMTRRIFGQTFCHCSKGQHIGRTILSAISRIESFDQRVVGEEHTDRLMAHAQTRCQTSEKTRDLARANRRVTGLVCDPGFEP